VFLGELLLGLYPGSLCEADVSTGTVVRRHRNQVRQRKGVLGLPVRALLLTPMSYNDSSNLPAVLVTLSSPIRQAAAYSTRDSRAYIASGSKLVGNFRHNVGALSMYSGRRGLQLAYFIPGDTLQRGRGSDPVSRNRFCKTVSRGILNLPSDEPDATGALGRANFSRA